MFEAACFLLAHALVPGGDANSAYDPCYHQFCDTIDNVNHEALAINLPVAAHAVQLLGTLQNLRGYLGYGVAQAELNGVGGACHVPPVCGCHVVFV